MRTHKLFSRLGLAMVAILLLSFTHEAFASGTAAGTLITNQASVSYLAGLNQRFAQSAVLNIYVGQKTVINYDAGSYTSNTVDGITIFQPFTVTNSGNGTDNFTLSVPSSIGNWTASIVGVGSDTVIVKPNTGSLAEDGTFSGQIKVVIPYGQTDGAINGVTLTATSTVPNSGNIVVLNHATLPVVWTVTIKKPVLTFSVNYTKSANQIPGETQNFDLTVNNTGTLATSGTSTITWNYDGTHLKSPVATFGVTQDVSIPGTAVWTIDPLAASGTIVLHLTAVIDQSTNNGTGVLYNTSIAYGSNGSQIAYNDGKNGITQNVSASTSFSVGLASGALITPPSAGLSGDPVATIEYTLTVKNTGNASNSFNFTDPQTGTYSPSPVEPVYSMTSGGPALTQPIIIGQGVTTATIYVRFVVPADAADGKTIIANVTATPVNGSTPPFGSSTVSSSDVITTTVTAPILTVVMSDSVDAGVSYGTKDHPYIGDVVYYIVRITNGGSGNATSVSSSNITATHTVYNTNSVWVDATNSTTFTQMDDGTSAGVVTVGPNNAGSVQVQFSSIASGHTSVYRYSVTVQ